MRYVTIPNPFMVRDAITDEPLGKDNKPTTEEKAEYITFLYFVRVLCATAASTGQIDTLTLIDIRKECAEKKPGDLWELNDEWYKILKAESDKLKGLMPSGALSAETHLRALADAPSKKPVSHEVSNATAS